jgi:hypothetical protein
MSKELLAKFQNELSQDHSFFTYIADNHINDTFIQYIADNWTSIYLINKDKTPLKFLNIIILIRIIIEETALYLI